MKLRTYESDNNISLNDKLTGTDADDANKTKNYTFQKIKDFLIAQGLGTVTVIDTSFINKTFASVMSIVYDVEQPNFEIDITGNLDLTVTGTVNGDTGLVNLYFAANQTATLNGFIDLVITGAGVMVPVYFIHDREGIKWYQ